MVAISEMGYDTTWYKLKFPIEVTFEPWEFGVCAINEEYKIHMCERSEEEAIKSAKWGLAKDYEHYLQTSDDGDGRFKFTEYGLKMKKKFLALVDTTIPISEVT